MCTSGLCNHHNRITAIFPGPSGWASARRELLDSMVQGKINRGRHTDHVAGRHSIRTKQCPPPSSPMFLQAGCPFCHPTNSVKALKATSAFGLGRRCQSSPQQCYVHRLHTSIVVSVTRMLNICYRSVVPKLLCPIQTQTQIFINILAA